MSSSSVSLSPPSPLSDETHISTKVRVSGSNLQQIPEDQTVDDHKDTTAICVGSKSSFLSRPQFISLKKNSTFNVSSSPDKRVFNSSTVNVKRSLSFDRFALAKRKDDAPVMTKTVLGKGLKRKEVRMVAHDELNQESHKIDDKALETVDQLVSQAEAVVPSEEENEESNCIVIGSKKGGAPKRRLSEVFIGSAGFYPLSQIKLPRPICFTIPYNDFEDVKHLTDGSNSVIFKARTGKMSVDVSKLNMPRGVILKVLSEQVDDPRRAKREFDFERDILAAVSHPNLVKIYGAGSFGDRPFLVMERLEGGSLEYLLADAADCNARIPLRKALQIAVELANVLQYLHTDFHPDAVLIHRDVKPDNVCFSGDGIVKLMDFGISTCIRRAVLQRGPFQMSGMTGSLRYMAPEVARREKYNEKVDVYSYGIVLWQVITAKTPFEGINRQSFIIDVVEGGKRPDLEEIRLAIPGTNDFMIYTQEQLIQIISSCWDPDPSKRPDMKDITATISQIQDEYMRDYGGVPKTCCTIM